MAAIDVSYYAKAFAKDNGYGDYQIITSNLQVTPEGDPQYATVTPLQEKRGPRVANMKCNPAKECFMNVSSKEQTLNVKVSIWENGVKGLNQTVQVPPPMTFDVHDLIQMDVGKAELHQSLVFRAPLNTAQTAQQTCVRLKTTATEADFSLGVSMKGSVIFRNPIYHNGNQQVQQTFAEIIRHLQSQRDPAANRFTVQQQKVLWTVRGTVALTSTSAS